MNAQRRKAYSDLIDKLLNSPKGQEKDILKAYPDLIDEELIAILEETATGYAQKGMQDTVDYLKHVAKIAADINPSTAEQSRRLLYQVLRVIFESKADSQAVYSLIEKNLGGLNTSFEQVLQDWASTSLSRIDEEKKSEFAQRVTDLSTLISQFTQGDRATNLEIARAGYEIVDQILTQTEHISDWANNQNYLGLVYLERIQGDRSENIEKAIRYFTAALSSCTPEQPLSWAEIHNSLGLAYLERIPGEKADNIEKAIQCFKAALEVYTLEKFPEQREMVQDNISRAYTDAMQHKIQTISMMAALKQNLGKFIHRKS